MSKIDSATLQQSIAGIREAAAKKPRKFVETIDLQIGLKGIDPSTDKRFSGSIVLPFCPCPRRTVCVFADAAHEGEIKKLAAAGTIIPMQTVADLKKLNKEPKPVKKLGMKYSMFLASDSLFKQIPRLLGPTLNKMGKFPTVVGTRENLAQKCNEMKSTVRFQLKKVLCLGVPVAHLGMSNEEMTKNIVLSINFLASLLKKGWQNIRHVHIKSSMGPSFRIY
ncbi:putative 60S ribosomal protein L10a [Paratrimastix pyriformis]|uniref:60S ribosomal protein L10a n=1 Tax=Paratrimastix pyriformis TaxID=342808 RepID=A0ABQ8UKK6_9EUKA|nr:putative 60S ribosomal protein L10a [Paratrimastix pyriformis]